MFVTLAEWLARKPKGKAPKKPLRLSVRVRKVSAKRAKENRLYSVKRKAFLETNRNCMLGGPLYSAGVNPQCTMDSSEVHHVKRRLAGNFLDESTWAATCANCHRYVETHAGLARTLGLIQT